MAMSYFMLWIYYSLCTFLWCLNFIQFVQCIQYMLLWTWKKWTSRVYVFGFIAGWLMYIYFNVAYICKGINLVENSISKTPGTCYHIVLWKKCMNQLPVQQWKRHISFRITPFDFANLMGIRMIVPCFNVCFIDYEWNRPFLMYLD